MGYPYQGITPDDYQRQALRTERTPDFVRAAWKLGFLLGNAVKYLSRAGKKDPKKLLEDLRKGRWYLDQAIERIEDGKGLF